MPWYTIEGQEILVRIRVQPRSSRCGLNAWADDRMKVRLTAAPVEGKANRQAVELLASLFNVPKSSVSLASGGHSRDKTFRVSGVASTASLPDANSVPGQPDQL